MESLLSILHWIAGFVVFAEALNKLERCAPLAKGLRPRERLTDALKALAWLMLAMGAAGALITPTMTFFHIEVEPHRFLFHPKPSLDDVLILAGFATLIVRTRVKEG